LENYSIIEVINMLDESNLENAERMLRSFYRTIEPHKKRNWKNPRRISWEVYAEKDKIGFYVVVPTELEKLICSRIMDAYPQVEVNKVEEDHMDKFKNPFVAEMNLHNHYVFSTKTDTGDVPLNSILGSMSKLEENEHMLMQVSMLPINNRWQGKAYRVYRDLLFKGKKPKKARNLTVKNSILVGLELFFGVVENVLEIFMPIKIDEQKNTPIERDELKGIQKKINRPAFNSSIRFAVQSPQKHNSNYRLTEIANSFIELDSDNEWRRQVRNPKKVLLDMKSRKVERKTNNIVTTSELAPVVRLTNKNIRVAEISRKILKTLPIPNDLSEGCYIAQGVHNNKEQEVNMSKELIDDLVHPFIYTGAVGGGKTTAIINNLLGKALAGYSTILVDTQGDVSLDFINQIPESEHHRIVWLNFADLDYPVPIDLMEFIQVNDAERKSNEAWLKDISKNELIGLCKKLWGGNFGPQTEFIMRNIITVMLETKGNFLNIYRMLIDNDYRESMIGKVRTNKPLVYRFFRGFQDNYSESQKTKMLMPSINKIGTFVESETISNIIAQDEQKYNFRKMMDEGKIVVVTIPKGVLIEHWKILTRLIVSKIWLATVSRIDIPLGQRKPAFLATDEAIDIITEEFEVIQSQARKFRLGLIFGFQYMSQFKNANRGAYGALVGNRPNVMAFKIGEEDIDTYAELFKGFYSKEELRSFPNLHGVARLSVNGKPTDPFTVRTPTNYYTKDSLWRKPIHDKIQEIAENSRKLYAMHIDDVKKLVDEKFSEMSNDVDVDELEELESTAEEIDESIFDQLRNLN
jgi:hypothetical protein